jgi:hypothetical protein
MAVIKVTTVKTNLPDVVRVTASGKVKTIKINKK